MTAVVVAGQTLVAGVFAASAVAKVRHRAPAARFTATVFRLAGASGRLARPAVTVAVTGEFAVVALLAGAWVVPAAPPWLATAAMMLALVLLLGFSAAVMLAVRAEVRAPCGCFGGSSAPPGPHHLVRNAVLAAGALAGAGAGSPDLSAPSLAAGAVGLGLAVALVALDDLVALFARPRRTVATIGTRRYP
jgi:hypothetical protein